MSIGLIHPPLLVTTIVLSIVSLILKEGTELFSPISIKVKSWIKEKFYSSIRKIPFVNKLEKNIKKTIENLTSDKLETRLQTQYDILKQELDNKEDMKPDKLISNNKVNHNSNTILKNLNIENNQDFDSSIRNTVNQQELQSSTISKNNWNKVKCLLTT